LFRLMPYKGCVW